MKTNVLPKAPPVTTEEGGRAVRQSPLEELTRAVSTCLLWEDTFYSKGSTVAARIAELSDQVTFAELAALAVRAREELKLRHAPLWLCCQLARRRAAHPGPIAGIGVIAETLVRVIQRPDEITEFLSLYWRDGKRPLSAQVKKGLAIAFQKFGEYALAKWDRKGKVRLRDALFLCHAKPKDEEQDALCKRLISGTMAVPDTWEVALSSGTDKRATWERLIREQKLGYIALLMNLRNMEAAVVDHALVEEALLAGAAKSRALPFRFISAAKHAPAYANALSEAMARSIAGLGKLDGSTVVLVDVSGSMDVAIAEKSTLLRWEAAAALAILARELTPNCRVSTFSDDLVEVMNVRGMGLLSAIASSQLHRATYLAGALGALRLQMPNIDRLIVITDEQSQDGIIAPWCERAYLVNVAPEKRGLDRNGGWSRIYGFSERIFDWIAFEETGKALAAEETE